LLLSVLALASLAGCSNETEGQPCDPAAGNGGNDDCASPLICTKVSAGNRCCPQDRSQATTVECSESAGGFDANPSPADVTGTDVTGTEEASVESGPDATPPAEGAATEASPSSDASDGGVSSDTGPAPDASGG
jgi:hypothetical protein